MRYIKIVGIAAFNLLMGYISFWWFILSYAAAFNVDHEAENEIFIPFGIAAILVLFIGVLGANWTIYKHRNRSAKGLLLIQVIPFILGLSISLFLASIRK